MHKFQIGQSESLTKTFKDEDVLGFAKLSGDDNPIHLDDDFARQSIFKRRIVQGMLTGSLISALIANHLPGRGSIYLKQDLTFLKPVFIGDTITAIVTIQNIIVEKSLYFLETNCFNQNNELVISGSATIKYK